MNNRPIAMDPQPPLCVLGCFNVRTWALIAAHIDIAACSLGILLSMFKVFDVPFGSTVLSLLVSTLFLLLNLQLRSAILERNIVPILLWLKVYITLFIANAVVLLAILILYLNLPDKGNIDVQKKLLIENALYFAGITAVISAFWIYSVYLYYDFEKKLLQQNRVPGLQTV